VADSPSRGFGHSAFVDIINGWTGGRVWMRHMALDKPGANQNPSTQV
jgi:hypothetical protein